MVLVPEDVTVDPARIAKDVAAPSEIGSGLAAAAAEDVEHIDGALIESPMSVTAPLIASSRPLTVAPALPVMDVYAMTVPMMEEVVPSVADEPTWRREAREGMRVTGE